MSVSDEVSAAVVKALDSARGLRHAGAGLVVVLFRCGDVTAVLHWRADGSVTATMAAVARSLEVDEAVLVVVGSTRVVGSIIVACDAAADELISAGLVVAARIHVRAIADGGMLWTDLGVTAAHDGSSPPWGGAWGKASRGRIRSAFGMLRRG